MGKHGSFSQKLLQEFTSKAGFKRLALLRLSSLELGVVLYLFDEAYAGRDQVPYDDAGLGNLLGYSSEEIRAALTQLIRRHVVVLHEDRRTEPHHPTSYLQLQLLSDRWVAPPASAGDQRKAGDDSETAEAGSSKILNFKSTDESLTAATPLFGGVSPPATWQRLFNAFSHYLPSGDEDLVLNRHAAQQLVALHTVDQVLLMIHHFQRRLPSLAALVERWDEFLRLFDQETQQIDLEQAREKHGELDNKLRQHIKYWLTKAADAKLTSEEIEVLEMMLSHHFPRRQLFWAYQARSRYHNLKDFFTENNALMLAVSSTGTIVKKPSR